MIDGIPINEILKFQVNSRLGMCVEKDYSILIFPKLWMIRLSKIFSELGQTPIVHYALESLYSVLIWKYEYCAASFQISPWNFKSQPVDPQIFKIQNSKHMIYDNRLMMICFKSLNIIWEINNYRFGFVSTNVNKAKLLYFFHEIR